MRSSLCRSWAHIKAVGSPSCQQSCNCSEVVHGQTAKFQFSCHAHSKKLWLVNEHLRRFQVLLKQACLRLLSKWFIPLVYVANRHHLWSDMPKHYVLYIYISEMMLQSTRSKWVAVNNQWVPSSGATAMFFSTVAWLRSRCCPGRCRDVERGIQADDILSLASGVANKEINQYKYYGLVVKIYNMCVYTYTYIHIS